MNTKKIMKRILVKQELITYLFPVPVIILFAIMGFDFARNNPVPFLIAATIASTVTMLIHVIVRHFYLKKAFNILENDKDNIRQDDCIYIKNRLINMPYFDAIAIILRYSIIGPIVAVGPLIPMGMASFKDIIAFGLLLLFTGLVEGPIFYLISENEFSNIIYHYNLHEVKDSKKTLNFLGFSKKIKIAFIFLAVYILGMFSSVFGLIMVGYTRVEYLTVPMIMEFIAAVGLSVTFALLLNRNIHNTFITVQEIATKVSQGDLRERIPYIVEDEIGVISKSFNKILEYFDEMILKIKVGANTMQDSSANISAMAEETSATTEQLASNTNLIQSDAEEVFNFVNDTYLKSENMLEDTEKATEKFRELNKDAKDIFDLVSSGKDIVAKMEVSIKSTVNDSNKTNESISTLYENAQEIKGIVDSLRSIADQTNLLSLNSAIEAARAGEAGKGFAVVADEISKLANQSQEETKKIESILGEIQKESEKSKNAIKTTVENVKEVNYQMDDITTKFGNISDGVSKITLMSEETLEGYIKQEKSTKEMTLAMKESSNLVEKISDKTKEISIGINEQASATQSVTESTEELNSNSITLYNYIKNFKVNESN